MDSANFFPEWSDVPKRAQLQIIYWKYHTTANLSVQTTVCLVNKYFNYLHGQVLKCLLNDDFNHSFFIFGDESKPEKNEKLDKIRKNFERCMGRCNKTALRIPGFLQKQDAYTQFLANSHKPIRNFLSESWLNIYRVNELSVMKEKNSKTHLQTIRFICEQTRLTDQVFHKIIKLAKGLSGEEYHWWDNEFNCDLDDQTLGLKKILTTLLIQERFDLVEKAIEELCTSSIDVDDFIKTRGTVFIKEKKFILAIKTAYTINNQEKRQRFLFKIYRSLLENSHFKIAIEQDTQQNTLREFVAEIVHYCKEAGLIDELLDVLSKLSDEHFKLMVLRIIESSSTKNEEICKYVIKENFKLAIKTASELIAIQDKEAAFRMIFDKLLKYKKFDTKIHNLLIKASDSIKDKKCRYQLYLDIYKGHLNLQLVLPEIDYTNFITDNEFYKFMLNQRFCDEAFYLGSHVQDTCRRDQLFETMMHYLAKQRLIDINNLEETIFNMTTQVTSQVTIKKLIVTIFHYCEQVHLIDELIESIGVVHHQQIEKKTVDVDYTNFIIDKEFYKLMIDLGYCKEVLSLAKKIQVKALQEQIYDIIFYHVFVTKVKEDAPLLLSNIEV